MNLATVLGKSSASRPRWQSASAGAIASAILWGYAAFAAVSALALPTREFDEAIPLVDGVLVQQGRIPNIDFPSFYPPLGPYVTAALFNLLGRTVVANRILGGGVYFLLIFFAMRLLRAHFPHSRAISAGIVLLVAASIGKGIALPSWPGFGLSAVVLLA
jgi:hypothetical protein